MRERRDLPQHRMLIDWVFSTRERSENKKKVKRAIADVTCAKLHVLSMMSMINRYFIR